MKALVSALCEHVPTVHQGVYTPWTANSELSWVEATLSGPPSSTRIWPSSQTERLPSSTVPGTSASIVVATEQADPVEVEPVGVHGTVTEYGMSSTVAASLPLAPLDRSVIRRLVVSLPAPLAGAWAAA
jgi:hypothetical protein